MENQNTLQFHLEMRTMRLIKAWVFWWFGVYFGVYMGITDEVMRSQKTRK